MTDDIRKQFDVYQGVDEEIIHRFTITNWGSTPTSISAVAKELPLLGDVTSTVFPTNSPSSPDSETISLSPLKALTAGTTYRIEVKFTAGGNIFELWGLSTGEL